MLTEYTLASLKVFLQAFRGIAEENPMAKIRITVQGKLGHISVLSFLAIINKSLGVLRNLDIRISEQQRGTLQWVITGLGEGSSYVDIDTRILRGNIDVSDRVVSGFANGVEHIRQRGGTPPYFSQVDVVAIRDIVRQFGRDGVEGVNYQDAESRVELTPEVEQELERLVGIRYKAYGSIEGKIELVSIKQGARRFSLTHDRTLRSIKCTLPDDIEGSVFNAAENRRRVIVTGLIAYNAKNEAISVEVKGGLRLLGWEKELPTTEDLGGSDPTFTGELSTEDFVRSLRDG